MGALVVLTRLIKGEICGTCGPMEPLVGMKDEGGIVEIFSLGACLILRCPLKINGWKTFSLLN